MKKTAVILFNLGGPDNLKAVRPFLFNLFNDPAIIRLPQPFRTLLAALISFRRTKTARQIYNEMGGSSPLLKNTELQARALEQKLGHDYRCFVVMRYWAPFAKDVVGRVINYAPDDIVLLPLYPQFSTTTTASSLKNWHEAADAAGLNVPVRTIRSYPTLPGFISTLLAPMRAAYEEAKNYGNPRILFSAHGLPESIIKAGDPYQSQCEETAATLAKALDIPSLDWVLCYQSRVGPLKWIGPAADAEIKRASLEKIPLIVVPISFVSEHSETLVELDIEYRHLAEVNGSPFYAYVPTVSTAHGFIEGLVELVQNAQSEVNETASDVTDEDFEELGYAV